MNEPAIDKDLLFERVGYKPHSEHQWQIHKSTARYRVPCCGRRFGKSQAVGHEITWLAFAPDSYIWIVGPTYKLGEKEYRVVYDDFMRKLRIKGIRASYNAKQGDMRMMLPWNTVVEVVSADKQDSLVGEGLDFACMSEAALHDISTWQMYIQPALSDKRGGALFPSTPRGNNWYKGMFMLGQNPTQTDYASWRFPTWYNKYRYPGGYDDPELVKIRANVTEHYWLQEYAAEFTAREGKIYKDWDETVHVKDITFNPEWQNYLAFDFGFTDPFCCYDIAVDVMQNVYIWREYQISYKTTWEHGQALKHRENPDGYHINGCYADARGADEIATLMLILGQYIEPVTTGWSKGVETVSRWLKLQPDGKPKLFIDRSCIHLIRQIGELQAPKHQEGKNAREGQRDYDDHGPDAVRYFFSGRFAEGEVDLEDAYGDGYGVGGADDGYRGSEAEGFFHLNANEGLKLT